MTKYGHGSVSKRGCSGAGYGVVALNRVYSDTGVCSVQSAAERSGNFSFGMQEAW